MTENNNEQNSNQADANELTAEDMERALNQLVEQITSRREKRKQELFEASSPRVTEPNAEGLSKALETVSNLEPEDYRMWAQDTVVLGGMVSCYLEPILQGIAREKGHTLTPRAMEQLIGLFTDYDFIESHFNRVIVNLEGSACSTDKSRTILRGLTHWLVSGKEIAWNFEQEYTYHLPKKVFSNHNEIVEFYNALLELKAGNPRAFFKCYNDFLSARIEQQGLKAAEGEEVDHG